MHLFSCELKAPSFRWVAVSKYSHIVNPTGCDWLSKCIFTVVNHRVPHHTGDNVDVVIGFQNVSLL